ncbi:MAG: sulfatase, partial [Ktedonobacteraceae bacterium]
VNCDDSPSKDLLLEYGWKDRPVAQEQLYDLIFDPNEVCNQVDNPALAPVLAEMRTRLEEWMRDTDDPLLQGPVPAQPGIELNDPDQISPAEPTHNVS